MVHVDMQERGAGGLDATAQRRLDVLDVVKPFGAVQIDDQMQVQYRTRPSRTYPCDALTLGESK